MDSIKNLSQGDYDINAEPHGIWEQWFQGVLYISDYEHGIAKTVKNEDGLMLYNLNVTDNFYEGEGLVYEY